MALPTASDNPFAKIIIRESANDGSDFSNPAADYRVLFLGEDGVLHLRDSSGTVTTPSAGSVAADGVSFDATGLDNTSATDVQAAMEDFDAAISAAGGTLAARTEVTLGADVTMTTANTAYDGPSATPAAGTYDVDAVVTVKTATNQTTAFVGRLLAGATVIDERQGGAMITPADNGYPMLTVLTARVVLDGSTILKIVAVADRAGCVMARDPFDNSTGAHRQTILVYRKVA